jgi:hypothetical protein
LLYQKQKQKQKQKEYMRTPSAPTKPGNSASGKTGKNPKPRKPDPVWDTVAELWFNGRVVDSDRPRVGKLVKRFKEHEATPDLIHQRRERYRQEPPWKDLPCTADAVLKHWDLLGANTNTKPRCVVRTPMGVTGE